MSSEAASSSATSPPTKDSTSREEEDGYSRCTSGLLFVSCLVVCGIALVVCMCGPKLVIQRVLQVLVLDHPQLRHAIAIFALLVVSITLGIPIILLLLPIPALMFGFWLGWVISFASLMVAALLSYLIGKRIGQQAIRHLLKKNQCQGSLQCLRVLEDEQDTMKFLILFRFLFIPMLVRNYGPAILHVSLAKLIVSGIPHSLWSSFVFSFGGSTFKDSAALLREGQDVPGGFMQWQQIVCLAVSVLAACFLAQIAWSTYMREAAGAQPNILVSPGDERSLLRADSANPKEDAPASALASYGATKGVCETAT